MEIRKNTKTGESNLQRWLIIFSMYLALIAAHGYRFGDEDMSETLSYALFLNDQSLYAKDLYIQSVGSSRLNERYPFTLLLSAIHNHLEWGSFLLHLISSLSLIVGLLALSEIYLKQKIWQFIFLVISLIMMYNTTLGGNEIWYNYFVPSHLAKAIGVWAVVYWLRKKVFLPYSLAALATFAQPVVGAQLALLFFLTDAAQIFIDRGKFQNFIRGPALYALTAGIWILAVFTSHIITDVSVNNETFYRLMETRLAHHFFPSYYPLKSWLILMPFFLLGTVVWKKRERRLGILFGISLAGMIIYILGIEVLEIPTLLSVQWFKTTVWLKPLSILAILVIVQSYFPGFSRKALSLLIVLTLVFAFLQISNSFRILKGKPYHFPFVSYHKADMEIALQLKELLSNEACIIIPPHITGIRYFSQRSLFVDYKSNIHSKRYLAEADARRKRLYNMTLDARRSGRDPVLSGSSYYANLTTSDFMELKAQGATHILTILSQKLNLPVVARNREFVVYAL